MAESQSSKLKVRVRFPSPAPSEIPGPKQDPARDCRPQAGRAPGWPRTLARRAVCATRGMRHDGGMGSDRSRRRTRGRGRPGSRPEPATEPATTTTELVVPAAIDDVGSVGEPDTGEPSESPTERRRRIPGRRRRPAGENQDHSARDTGADRGLREIVGAGPSQLGVSGALRGRDVNRPTAEDLAAAERDVVIVRRHWRAD